MSTPPDGSHTSPQDSPQDSPQAPGDASSESQRSLREWRVLRGMTQQQLAFATGLSITTVRDVERGHHEPTLHTARKLLRALDITLEQVAFPDSPSSATHNE